MYKVIIEIIDINKPSNIFDLPSSIGKSEIIALIVKDDIKTTIPNVKAYITISVGLKLFIK